MNTSKIVSLTMVLGFSLFGAAHGQIDPTVRLERYAVELDNLARDDTSSKTRDRAKRWILKPFNQDLLIESSDDLINALDDYSTSELSCEILGLLELPKEIKVAVLDSDMCPDKVKARLGDMEAMQRIIAQFNTAEHLAALRVYCRELLYAENPTTLVAFKSRLESDTIMQDPHGREIAVVMTLVAIYAEFHPEQEPISHENLRKHAYVGKENFGDAIHQNFLRQVEEHFEGILGVRPTIDVPFLQEGIEYVERFEPIETEP